MEVTVKWQHSDDESFGNTNYNNIKTHDMVFNQDSHSYLFT